ncbi:hypothetical protein ACPCKW_18675 [Streptomyces griseoincarnatus]
MATITAVMGEPWEPNPGLRAMLASMAKTQKLLASTTALRQTPLLLQQQRLASLTASLSAAQTAMKPLLDALDRSQLQRIAAGMPSRPDFAVAAEGWRKQSEQLHAGLELLRRQAPPDLNFSPETFDQAETILQELSQNPPAQDPSVVPDELTAETEAQVEETIQIIQPVLTGMDRRKARALVVTYVSVLVFLLSVHLSLTYPEVTDLLTETTGGDSLVYATGAGWLAGKIWDRLNPGPDDAE